MKTIQEKIRIKKNDLIGLLNAPVNLKEVLKPLPSGVRMEKLNGKNYNQIYWFVKAQAEVQSQMSLVIASMNDITLVWAFFPKGTSGIQTDLTRDKGWDVLMGRDDLRWLSMISLDDTWSAFAFRKKNESDRRQEGKTTEREIFKWADSKTKTLILPDDVDAALHKNIAAKKIFDALAFSHRRSG